MSEQTAPRTSRPPGLAARAEPARPRASQRSAILPGLAAILRAIHSGWSGSASSCVLIVVAICAPVLTSYDPIAQNMADRLTPPSWQHLLGTDEYGRDVYARIVYGARTTLYIVMLVARHRRADRPA